MSLTCRGRNAERRSPVVSTLKSQRACCSVLFSSFFFSFFSLRPARLNQVSEKDCSAVDLIDTTLQSLFLWFLVLLWNLPAYNHSIIRGAITSLSVSNYFIGWKRGVGCWKVLQGRFDPLCWETLRRKKTTTKKPRKGDGSTVWQAVERFRVCSRSIFSLITWNPISIPFSI